VVSAPDPTHARHHVTVGMRTLSCVSVSADAYHMEHPSLPHGRNRVECDQCIWVCSSTDSVLYFP